MSQQIEAFAERVIDAVRGYVKKEIGEVRTEMRAMSESSAAHYNERFEALPLPEKGEPGKDGESVDFDAVVSKVVELVPKPANGRDGIDGKDATVDLKALAELIPKPSDGKDGNDGKSVSAEDFRQLFEAEHAKAMLEFERRANDHVQKFLEKIPHPADGKDGFGFDDLEMKHDGERLFTFRFVRGEQAKEFSFVIPAVIYRGIYKSGTYQAGDSVTYAGSTFIAKRETQAKPETEDWQLSSKRGRDGKDADRPDATERVVRLK